MRLADNGLFGLNGGMFSWPSECFVLQQEPMLFLRMAVWVGLAMFLGITLVCFWRCMWIFK